MEANINVSCIFSANEFIFPQRNKQIMKIKYKILGFTSLQQCNGAEANTHKVIRISKSRVNGMQIQMNGLASTRMTFVFDAIISFYYPFPIPKNDIYVAACVRLSIPIDFDNALSFLHMLN